ncbi:alpha/beta hydrolase [Saccharothrix violaceirubra]|uniref:Pimeloyl-ACP methyl ester carboxylesterase n=1 Tax=Saccharothrix violaceirubra TaxID=413306 RepID=A0A7W7T465_9PSEU|nr:alpha/beta fold hydrolase [Saccharothrix violaceirubra]MBB4965727.1 pimeloyl-ACP methyl ester carboxylesterase [Saccharothrix violaceirubra]
MRRLVTLTAAVLGLVVVPPAHASPGLDWRACADGVECADLTVPADWDHRAGPKASVHVGRLKARGARQGTIVVNLGGPGPQVEYLTYLKPVLAELTETHDLVFVDPRGLGGSTPVTCPTASAQRPRWVFTDRADYENYKRDNAAFAAGCLEKAGPLALDARQVAHDLDAVRAALGQRRLDYFGNSYGTVYAQAYAQLFPHRIGRMYLDSALDHTDQDVARWVGARAAVDEANLGRMASWCDRERSCALHGRDVRKVFADLLARAPIPTAAGGSVDAAMIVSRMYVEEPGWASTTLALAEADAGDATRFTVFEGARDPDMSRVAMCADFAYPQDYPALKALEERTRRTAPLLGWRHVWVMANHCAGMPAPTFRQRSFHSPTAALVVNGDHDHATPPAHGLRVAERMAGSRYVRVPAGHAVYWVGNRCVRDHVHRYFRTGELPPVGASCPGN